jgi:hypothetical protein
VSFSRAERVWADVIPAGSRAFRRMLIPAPEQVPTSATIIAARLLRLSQILRLTRRHMRERTIIAEK